MLKYIPRFFIGIITFAAVAILCQWTSVLPLGSLLAQRDEGARHDQAPTTFSSNSEEQHQQESFSVHEPKQTSSICTDPPPGHCEFYRDCLESKFHCGESGYPLGYGEKFCQKFVAGQDQLSPAGQKWMMGTMQCLQRVLVPDATVPGVSDASLGMDAMLHQQESECGALKEKAFNSHSRCYLDNGLCALSGRDWVHIVEIIGVQTLFDSWAAIKESIEAAEGCL